MPMPELPQDLSRLSLAEVVRLADANRPAPVETWHPAHCGHSGMRIARDGTWFHEGSPIARHNLVRLFSTILRREPDGGYVLVTPAERLDIDVEDAPFIAVELKAEGAGPEMSLAFRLNTGTLVVAGPEHPLRFVDRDDGPHPYLQVRPGLEALIARPVYYELVELALAGGAEPPGLWSGGRFFAVAPSA